MVASGDQPLRVTEPRSEALDPQRDRPGRKAGIGRVGRDDRAIGKHDRLIALGVRVLPCRGIDVPVLDRDRRALRVPPADGRDLTCFDADRAHDLLEVACDEVAEADHALDLALVGVHVVGHVRDRLRGVVAGVEDVELDPLRLEHARDAGRLHHLVARARDLDRHPDEVAVLHEVPRDEVVRPRRAHALGVGLLAGGYGMDELVQAGAYRVYEDPAELTRHIDELGVQATV